MRIEPKGASQLNSLNTPSHAGQAGQIQRPVQEEIRQSLFGRPRPMVLDERLFPDLAVLLRVLRNHRRKFNLMAQETVEGEIVLAESTIAAIDEHATIYVGATFLLAHQHMMEIPIGAVAHEVGHRPRFWGAMRQELPSNVTAQDLAAICRHEETRADMFAGRALAEVGLSAEPMTQFLMHVQTRPHPEYLPADVRASIILDAHAGGAYRSEARQKIFPDHHRAVSARDFIGEF